MLPESKRCVRLPSIALKAMKCLASCTTRVEWVSSIAFELSPGHAALGILCHPNQTGAFDWSPLHAALGILHHPNRMGEFDWLRLISRPCDAWHPVPHESNGWVWLPSIVNRWVWLPSIALNCTDCTQGHEVLGILRYPSQTVEFNCTPEGNRTCPFDLGSSRCRALHSLRINLRQSNSLSQVNSIALLHRISKTSEFDHLRLISRPCSAWHSASPESNGWVRLPSIDLQTMQRLAYAPPKWNRWVRLPSIDLQTMQRLAFCATWVKQVNSIAFLRHLSKTEFDCLKLMSRPCSTWHLDLPKSNRQVQISRATRVKLARSIAFDRTQGHEALGILCHPSETGEVDCLRSHPRPWSAWHPAPPESNWRGRLPSIAPKAMKLPRPQTGHDQL